MNYLQGTTEHEIYTVLAAGFLAGGSRQEKASVRLPCSGKKLAANGWRVGVRVGANQNFD